MNKTVLGIIVALLIVAGGAYLYTHNQSASQGTMATSTSADTAGSVKPETTTVVSENLQGKWQSTSDPKNVIEFQANDKIVWTYDGKEMADGLYVVFTKENAPKLVAFPIDANAVYVQTTETGSQNDTMNFRIMMSADANELTLIYMERGGATVYKRVQ